MSIVSSVRLATFVAVVASAPAIPGQDTDWARAMIDKDVREIDFKEVARFQWVEIPIRLTNLYKEEIRITGLYAEAGCVSWQPHQVGKEAIPLPGGSETVLTLVVDTTRFTGVQQSRSATINFLGSSPVTVGRFRGRSSAQARQKGAAPTTFAFASPRICEGDAKAKAEGANRIYRERVENTDHQFERQIQPAFRMLESPCFASDSRLSVRFSPTVTGDEAVLFSWSCPLSSRWLAATLCAPNSQH